MKNKAVYLAPGVCPDDRKDVLDLWFAQTEGAKFWLRIVSELRDRGIADILIAVLNGLKLFPEAIDDPILGWHLGWARGHGDIHFNRGTDFFVRNELALAYQ